MTAPVVAPRSRRPMAGLLVAQAVSICGTRMSMVALPWFVLVTTGSALRTGIVAFAELLPYVVVSVAAAPLTDRFGARRTSIVCDVGSTAAVCAIPLLHDSGHLGFPLLLALAALAGSLRGPGDNAKHVLMAVAAEAGGTPLERAAGLYDGVNRAASLLGAPLAGVLIGVLGAADVLLVDAATFAVAAVVVAATAPRPRPVGADPTRYRDQVLSGLRFLGRQRLLLSIALMLFLTNLLDQAYTGVLLPVWSRDQGHGALGVGLAGGFFGAGATAGALLMVAVGARVPRRKTFLVCFLVAGCPRFFATAAGADLWVVLALAAVGGVAAGALNPILSAVELERIPEEMRARVLAAMTAIAWGGMPLGGLVAGWLVTLVGGPAALLVCGLAYLAATLVPLGRTWRDMDRRPAPAAPTALPG